MTDMLYRFVSVTGWVLWACTLVRSFVHSCVRTCVCVCVCVRVLNATFLDHIPSKRASAQKVLQSWAKKQMQMKAETRGEGEVSGRGREAGGCCTKKTKKTRLAYAR